MTSYSPHLLFVMQPGPRFSVLFVLFVLALASAKAQPLQPENEENSRMIQAYSFYLKQKMSLEYVISRFPNLKEKAEGAMNEWNREFLPSVVCIDSVLNLSLKEEWKKNKDELYDKFIRVDNSNVTEENAKEYINVVNDRSFGHIQTPVMETFLVWQPDYRVHPENEFTDGYTNSFSTKNKRSQLAVNIRLHYPKSWRALDGNKKSNIIQTFTSGYGLGNVMMAFTIEKSRTPFTKDKIKVQLAKEGMTKTQPSGCSVLSYNPDMQIDNCQASSITVAFEKEIKEVGKSYYINDSYTLFYKEYKITLCFTIASKTRDEANATFFTYQKLIKRMVDSVVILSQWGQ